MEIRPSLPNIQLIRYVNMKMYNFLRKINLFLIIIMSNKVFTQLSNFLLHNAVATPFNSIILFCTLRSATYMYEVQGQVLHHEVELGN